MYFSRVYNSLAIEFLSFTKHSLTWYGKLQDYDCDLDIILRQLAIWPIFWFPSICQQQKPCYATIFKSEPRQNFEFTQWK